MRLSCLSDGSLNRIGRISHFLFTSCTMRAKIMVQRVATVLAKSSFESAGSNIRRTMHSCEMIQ